MGYKGCMDEMGRCPLCQEPVWDQDLQYRYVNGNKTDGVCPKCFIATRQTPGDLYKAWLHEYAKTNARKAGELLDILEKKEKEMIKIYTDGSYNDNKGGVIVWSFAVVKDGEKQCLKGRCSKATPEQILSRNIAAEIKAARMAIRYALEMKTDITLVHDYEGIGKWPNKEWKAKIKLTRDYVKFVQTARESIGITFEWVHGHTGDKFNELVDSTCTRLYNEYQEGE